MSCPDFASESEDELRRYLRHASCLLAMTTPETGQRIVLLVRARHWTAAALAGIDRILRAAGTIDDTAPHPNPAIRGVANEAE